MQEYPMKVLRFLFAAIHLAGFVGIGAVFIYFERTFLRQDSYDLFDPALHLIVLLNMLTSPLFWIMLVITIAGHFGKVKLELLIGKRLRKEWGKSE